LVLKVAWPDLGWPLLTGGRYSEVAVNTGLTVYRFRKDLNIGSIKYKACSEN
jgi:hypothetical protein